MIQKPNLHFNLAAEFWAKKISVDIDNTTYITGSIDAEPVTGEPDIMYDSVVFIKETRQIWMLGELYTGDSSNQWYMRFEIDWTTGCLHLIKSQSTPIDFAINDNGELIGTYDIPSAPSS